MKQITLFFLYYLSFALPWMANPSSDLSTEATAVNSVFCDPTDSLALVDFFNQTNGGPCFPSSPLPGWDDPWVLTDLVCTWPGITLDANGRVIAIELNSSGLTGDIPIELSLLTELQELKVSNNCLTGTIPTEFEDLVNMRQLWIDGNELVGEVPEELCNMEDLTVFFLDENNLTGTFPFCFNNLNGLGTIDMFDNCFDSLPDLTGALSLTTGKLRVYNNKLTFDDLLPNIDDIATFYSPQDSVCVELDTTVQTGTVFNLSLGIDAGITTNSYQWYRNGVPFGPPNNSNTLVFDPVSFAAAGVYHCQVTNPAMPLLTLQSRSKTVTVVCGTSSFEFVEDVCSGFEIDFGGVTYDEGNPTFMTTLSGADQFGCDSIINIQLTFSTPPPTPLDTILCPGESITVNGTVYDEANDSGLESFGIPDQFNCDSSVQVNVTFYPEAISNIEPILCMDDTFSIAGQEFHFQDSIGQIILEGLSFHGCDSTINIDLNFYPLATSTITDTYCTGQEVILNGTTYNAGNRIGADTLFNESWRGCDSIVIVDLTFGDGVEFDLDSTICDGQEVIVNGTVYDCDNPTGSETIIGGSFLNCDSTINVNITCSEPEHGTFHMTVCPGGSFEYFGMTYDEIADNGEQNIGGIGQFGCDSIVDVSISFYSPSFSILDTTICENEDLIIDGDVISNNGPLVIPGGSFRGCDSTVFITINELPVATNLINDVLCPGGTITVNGEIYDEVNDSGTETIFGGAFNGCDSIITIDITFGTAVISQTDEILCDGDSLVIGTIVLNPSNTVYTDTIFGGSFSGCDSITNINISYHPVSNSQFNPNLCPGESLDFGGVTIDATNPSDTIVVPNGSYTGCDSTIMVIANILTVETGAFSTTLCPGDSIVINGTTYDEVNDSGTETIPIGSFQGCDTTFTVNIDFYPVASSNIVNTLCDGESLDVGGVILDASNPSDTVVIPNASFHGCDSLVIVNLEFYPPATSTIDYTLCFGQQITVNGTIYDQVNDEGTETLIDSSFYGCDSIVIIDLNFNSSVQITIDDVFCDPSAEVIVNNKTYNILMPMGIDTMMSFSGCDSIVTTDLTYPDSAFVFYNDILCPGDEILVNGVPYNEDMPSGTEVEAGASLFGCDVYHVVDLSFYEVAESFINETLCAGEDTLINAVLFDVNNTSDTIILSDASFRNCDSMVIVNIDFYPEIIVQIDSSLCEGQSVIVNGTAYDFNMPSGTEVMNSFTGCDSTVIINLIFDGAVVNNYTESICEGEAVTINGTLYDIDNPMGSDTFPDGSFTGCDSIMNIVISFLPPSFNNIDTTLCPGEELIINNTTYNELNLGGMDTLFNQNFYGCDSILTINIAYFPIAQHIIDTTLCHGESFEWNGMTYPPDQSTVTEASPGGSFAGCDSTTVINISYYDLASDSIMNILCSGEELELHGMLFNESNLSGDILLEGESFNGCDSTISVSISYYPPASSSEELSICSGDTIIWNGLTLTMPGQYEVMLEEQSFYGCDSAAMLNLMVLNPADFGLANAGMDQFSCGETLLLSANLPSNTSGTWSLLEGSADISDTDSNQPMLSNMGANEIVLSWSLSSDLCSSYDSDTIVIMASVLPDAVDDQYTGEPGILEIPISILDNDSYDDITDWYFNILEEPDGELDDEDDGIFNYLATPDLLGSLISFQYELCNEDCPEACDTATVNIQLQEEIMLEFPNTITVNGDGINDVFVVPDIVDQPDQFSKQELIVFNRWGDVVFSAKPYLNDWDGTNKNGNELPQGTYYYVLRLDVGAGIIYRGDITILK